MFVQGLVAGVVFAKLSRPNKRKRTIIFSNNAVITERDGKLCFLFKIGNIRISQLSDARIKLILIKSRLTKEGEFIPLESYDCKVGYEWSGQDTIFFPYPKIVEHVIDENSPLYEILLTNNKAKSDNDDYEIVAILEGNIETTGASCHIRTSYLPDEILWGYRFVTLYPYVNNLGYSFDFSKFNQVEPVNSNLFNLNRNNNNYSKIFSKINKNSKNYTKSLPLPAFLKRTAELPPQLASFSTSKYSSQKSLESIFNPYDTVKQKPREEIEKIMPIRNGRFTIVPVADDTDTYDETMVAKSNSLIDGVTKIKRQQTFNSTITSSVQFDEGYLTCKNGEVKKGNIDRYFK
jgi:hypothetical protein